MAQRRRRERLEPSRKEQALTQREREQRKRLYIAVGVALGLAGLLLAAGLIYTLLILPRSAVAVVNGETISTRDLAVRTRFEQTQYENQLASLFNMQDQFDPTGQQGFFTSQIQQLQGVLADPEGLANQVLERMIEETVIRQEAAKAGITVDEAALAQRINEYVAQGLGGVTAPQATATAEALAAATATPLPTPAPTLTTTAVLTPTATPAPTPTTYVVAQADIDKSFQEQIANIQETSGLSETAFRQFFADELLRARLLEVLGSEMPTTGERVQASHILVSVAQDAPEADVQTALAKAISITQQINNGADFAELAQKFSDDTGSAANGGDLGFFGRGQMVQEFEDAAFALDIGQVTAEPVRSQFGYHIIKVTGKDQGEPDFNQWLQERKAAAQIERRLTDARLPKLPEVPATLFRTVTQPVQVPTLAPSPDATPAPEQ